MTGTLLAIIAYIGALWTMRPVMDELRRPSPWGRSPSSMAGLTVCGLLLVTCGTAALILQFD